MHFLDSKSMLFFTVLFLNSWQSLNWVWVTFCLMRHTVIVQYLFSSPHPLVGREQTVQGVCSPVAPHGWSGPAPHDYWNTSAPPLWGPGSNTSGQSQRRSASGHCLHSTPPEMETWPAIKTKSVDRWRRARRKRHFWLLISFNKNKALEKKHYM